MTLAIGGNVLLLTLSGYHWIKSCLFELEYCPKNARPNRYRHKIKLLNSMFLFFNSCTPWAMYLLYINNYLFGETGAKVFSITFIILLGTQVRLSANFVFNFFKYCSVLFYVIRDSHFG